MQFVEHLNVNCALLRAAAGGGAHTYCIVRAEAVPFELDAGAALAAAETQAHADGENRHAVVEREKQVRMLAPGPARASACRRRKPLRGRRARAAGACDSTRTCTYTHLCRSASSTL